MYFPSNKITFLFLLVTNIIVVGGFEQMTESKNEDSENSFLSSAALQESQLRGRKGTNYNVKDTSYIELENKRYLGKKKMMMMGLPPCDPICGVLCWCPGTD
jgi:hypothetical protein